MTEAELIESLIVPDDNDPTRGTDVSRELTEVRTVLSRAETAYNTLQHYRNRGTWNSVNDPEINEMMIALMLVVRMLRRWRRTGRTKQVIN